MRKKLIITILYLSIFEYINAQQNIIFDEKFQFTNVLPYIDLYAQSDTSIEIKKVLSGNLTKVEVNKSSEELFFPPKQLCYWADFKIENKTAFDREILLEVSKPDLDHLQLFVLDSLNQVIKTFPLTGDHVPFKQHPTSFRYFTFPLQIAAHSKYRYLMFFEKYSAFLQLDLKLYSNQSYIEQKQWIDIKEAGYIVLFLIMSLIALFLFIVLKTRLAFYYFLYVSCYFVYWIAYLGWGTQTLWPSSLGFNDQIRNYLHLCGLTLTGLILKDFCNLAITLPRWNKFLTILLISTPFIFLYIFYFPLAPLSIRRFGFITCWIIGTLLAVSIFIIGVIHLIKYREKSVFLLLLAHFAIVFGTILFFITILNLLEGFHFSFGNFFSFTFFSTVLLSYIVANKMLIIQKEHQVQQKELTEAKQRALTNIIIGQEIERQQISQRLHDSISITLATLKMKFSSVFDTDRVENEDIYMDLDEISEEVRNISHELSPVSLSEGNLANAIKDSLGRVQYLAPELKIVFNHQLLNEEIVDTAIKKALFFISQELLYNIVKHANANKVELDIRIKDEKIIYTLIDDGQPFDSEEDKKGIGFHNIKARLQLLNGTLTLSPNQQQGMTRMIVIPIVRT
jgi:signal transduction histidine kinase